MAWTVHVKHVRLSTIALIAAVSLGRLARAQESTAVWRFDFGKKGAPSKSVWKDFTRIEPAHRYTPEKGYGFDKGSTWRVFEAERLDPLAADSIRLDGSFRADVPSGKYRVYIVAGSPGRAYDLRPVVDRLTYGLSVQGHELRKPREFEPQRFLDHIYSGINRDYVPGEDWYDIFVKPLFDEYCADVDAAQGSIVVKGDRAWIAGMVVFPASRAEEFDRFAGQLSADRKAYLQKAVPFRIPEEVEDQEPAELSQEEKDRGYRLWWRHPLRHVYPATEPEEDELEPGQAFASLGEIEPVTLAVRALRPMKNVRLRAGEVKTEDGSVLPTSAFEIEMVKYCYGFPMRAAHGTHCTIVPGYIRAAAAIDIPKDLTRQFWIRINVPEDAKPGAYDGSFILEGGNIQPGRAQFRLTVLPFKLKDAYDCADFYYGGPTTALWRRLPEMKELVEVEAERMLRFMRRYCLAPTLGYDNFSWVSGKTEHAGAPGQHIEYDQGSIDRFKRLMKLYREIMPKSRPFYVLNHAMPHYSKLIPWKRDDRGWQVSDQPDETWLALKQYLGKMQELQRETGAPAFRYLLAFEETNGGQDNVAWGACLLQKVKAWYPGLERVATAITPYEGRMEAPHASILCTSGRTVPFTDVAYCPKPGPKRRCAVYQPAYRFNYGFFLAAVGGEFAYREHFTYACGNPFNAFDGHDYSTSFAFAAMPGPDGPMPFVLLENWREGIDDLRYIKTLEEKIAGAKRTGSAKAAADEAARFLSSLLSSINPDENYYVNEVGYWDPEVYDHHRWEIAKRIERLCELMR